MPTIWHDQSGKDVFVEDMDTPLLCTLAYKWHSYRWLFGIRMSGNGTEEQLQAIAKTLRFRMRLGIRVSSIVQSRLQLLVPTPCHCGRVGTHSLGPRTRCPEHAHELKEADAVYQRRIDARTVERVKMRNERSKASLRSFKHYQARGRK